jgi:hypothetical protein
VTATITSDWSYLGLQAVVLENERVRVVVLPELGGKVWEIHDLVTRRQLLWHNPRVRPSRVPFGSGYDDVFSGGWDELFPNDVPEKLGEELYPDHGETWTLPWSWELEKTADAVSVHLEVVTPISSCTLRKTISLTTGERHLRVEEDVENGSGRDLPYLWKQHLAVAVGDGARIDLPARHVVIGDFGSPRAGSPGNSYVWPHLVDETGRTHDMRLTLPPASRRSEFQYATDLTAGWCAVTHRDGTGLGLSFDTQVFPSCWTFASYGGWRNLQVAVLEPCTGFPLSVADGVAAGTHQVLAAGATVSTSLTLVLFDGVAGVREVTADGRVTEDAT